MTVHASVQIRGDTVDISVSPLPIVTSINHLQDIDGALDKQLEYSNAIEYFRQFEGSRSDDEYYEIHHIIPSSLGGNDTRSNLIKLLPSEHYYVHCLLLAATNNNPSMVYALMRMSSTQSRDYCDSDSYAAIRTLAQMKRRGGKYYSSNGVTIFVEMNEPIPDGFVEGRTSEFLSKLKKSCINNHPGVLYHHIDTQKMIRIQKGDTIPDGYSRGAPLSVKLARLGSRWYHNPITGEIKVVLKGDDAPDGFVEGMTNGMKNGRTGKIPYYHPDTGSMIRVRRDEPIPDGYVYGFPKLFRDKISNHNATRVHKTGYTTYHNPITRTHLKIYPGDVVPSGYLKGMCPRLKKQ